MRWRRPSTGRRTFWPRSRSSPTASRRPGSAASFRRMPSLAILGLLAALYSIYLLVHRAAGAHAIAARQGGCLYRGHGPGGHRHGAARSRFVSALFDAQPGNDGGARWAACPAAATCPSRRRQARSPSTRRARRLREEDGRGRQADGSGQQERRHGRDRQGRRRDRGRRGRRRPAAARRSTRSSSRRCCRKASPA